MHQAKERLSPARRGDSTMPHPAPAHKSFIDRNSLYQEITDKIIAELEQGRVPWVQPWANVSAPLGLLVRREAQAEEVAQLVVASTEPGR